MEKVTETCATKTELSTLQSTVDGIVSTGGEANVIDTVKVNGTALTVSNKAVDVTVPTAVSELTNDSWYQTSTQVSTAIQTAISATGHASFEVATSVPSASAAEENVLYLVMNSDTGHYDIYALVSGSVVLIDDTTVDLSDYAKTSEVTSAISSAAYTHPTYTSRSSGLYKITVDGTGHVSGAIAVTSSDISGLGVEITDTVYTHPSYTSRSSGLYKITVDATGHVSAATAVTSSDISSLGVAITDTTYSVATTTANGLMSSTDKSKLDGIEIATDTEVSEMLDEVFA